MAVAVTSITASARAEEAAPVWQGVWIGTIGALPVHVCLKNTYAGRGFYYYRNRSVLITLTQAADSKVWVEGDGGRESAGMPSWTFSVIGRAGLSGTWHMKGRTLPFRLRPVANPEDGVCSSAAFNAPRIPKPHITRKPGVQDGVAYTRLVYEPGPAFDVSVETFALSAAIKSAARINRLLADDLPRPGTNNGIECLLSAMERGQSGMYNAATRPVMITPRWLATLKSVDYECGGPHPDGGTYPALYDLKSGKAVDPLDWFAGTAVKHTGPRGTRDDLKTITPVFRQYLLAQTDREPECNETYDMADYWDVGIDRKGFVFQPSLPHVAAGCVVTIPVRFAQLRRFLSPSGRAVVASIQADIAGMRGR